MVILSPVLYNRCARVKKKIDHNNIVTLILTSSDKRNDAVKRLLYYTVL